ncbi:hypothetical protein RND81_01G216500 [Saponaria officinalis]|uniref:Uncharacterized protein n=1 Tax=Saponaria officinalis TaxID=3572 RepID=A0AAW1NGD9_SAPOF
MVKLESGKMGTNDVIVTVYEESSKVRSIPRPQNGKIRDPNTNTNTNTNTNPRRSFGYDRRAELLAHVHHLRSGGPQMANHDPSPIEPIPKTKTRRLGALSKKLRFSLGGIFGERKKRWRYESIETQKYGRKYKLCCPRKRNCSSFSKRFRRMLRQFSCLWKCNKFSETEENQDLDSQMVDKHNVSR